MRIVKLVIQAVILTIDSARSTYVLNMYFNFCLKKYRNGTTSSESKADFSSALVVFVISRLATGEFRSM